MKTYIECELIEAEPMTRGDYNRFRDWAIPKEENPADEGYLVKHNDSFINWIPKKEFEKHHFGLVSNKHEIFGVDSLDEEDYENFRGKEYRETISHYSTEIGVYLGGTYEISSEFFSFDQWKREVYKQEALSRLIYYALINFAFYGFNYRKGADENEKKNN